MCARMKTELALGAMGLLFLSTGCAGVSIEPETKVPHPPQVASSTLVVGEVTRPRDLTTAAPFYVAMQRDLNADLERASLASRIIPERDLSADGVQGKAFALRYRVVEDNVVVTSTGGGCYAALLITGSFTLIPLFFLGACTASAEHRMTVEARVFDLSTAQVKKVQDSNSNELLNVYDTSTLTPILRKEYPIKVIVTVGVGKASSLLAGGEERLELSKQEALEATRQLLAQSIDDVARVLQRSN
jgi:hypothetical protein